MSASDLPAESTSQSSALSPRALSQRQNAALRTGLFSKRTDTRIRDRKAARVMQRVRSVAPWIGPSDVFALRNFARLEVIISRAYQRLARDPEPSGRALDELRRLIALELPYLEALGLSVKARAELNLSTARTVSLAEAIQQAAERNRAEVEAAEVPKPVGRSAVPEDIDSRQEEP